MPENLTTWKVRVWGMGHGTRVGEGSAEVITTKNLLVRLQAPRFFTETDEVVLSANVHNYLESAKTAKVRLEVEGGTLELMADNLEQVVEIPADGEIRVDWRVKAVAEGVATVRMLALTDEESDAMQMAFPVQVHGMLKQEAWSGVVRAGEPSGSFTVKVPSERRPEQTRLEVRYSPTLAGAMVDALPYLVDYPYGCTEQTLSRFLPAAIVAKTRRDRGPRTSDPRFLGTLAACEAELKRGAHVFRYANPDDFGMPETAFNICTFWYISALAAVGRRDEARALYCEMLEHRTSLGLLSEDLDPGSGELWGNFPQTYSMVGIIMGAMRLSRAWEEAL
jgi:hypothetical protein